MNIAQIIKVDGVLTQSTNLSGALSSLGHLLQIAALHQEDSISLDDLASLVLTLASVSYGNNEDLQQLLYPQA